MEGQWDIALRDLEYAIGLDANDDGVLTWGEVRARQAEIAAYALARLEISADGRPLALKVTDQLIADHPDGGYAVVQLRGRSLGDAGRSHSGLSFVFGSGSLASGAFSGAPRRLDADGGLRPRAARNR